MKSDLPRPRYAKTHANQNGSSLHPRRLPFARRKFSASSVSLEGERLRSAKLTFPRRFVRYRRVSIAFPHRGRRSVEIFVQSVSTMNGRALLRWDPRRAVVASVTVERHKVMRKNVQSLSTIFVHRCAGLCRYATDSRRFSSGPEPPRGKHAADPLVFIFLRSGLS